VPPQQHDRCLSIVSKSKWKTNLAAVQGIDDWEHCGRSQDQIVPNSLVLCHKSRRDCDI
jgi:hypothetical protein